MLSICITTSGGSLVNLFSTFALIQAPSMTAELVTALLGMAAGGAFAFVISRDG